MRSTARKGVKIINATVTAADVKASNGMITSSTRCSYPRAKVLRALPVTPRRTPPGCRCFLNREDGSRASNCPLERLIPSSIASASPPANRCRCSVRNVGFIRMTRAAGFSGIAGITWGSAWSRRIAARSNAGKRCVAISRKSAAIATRATCSVAAGQRQALLHCVYEGSKPPRGAHSGGIVVGQGERGTDLCPCILHPISCARPTGKIVE